MIAHHLVNESPKITALKRTHIKDTNSKETLENKTTSTTIEGACINSDKRSPTFVEKYGYEEATPDDKSMCSYDDASPDIKTTCSYEDMSPRSVSSRCNPFCTSNPRRSSLKQNKGPLRTRRASIHMGEEIAVRLPGRKEPLRRRSLISFDKDVRVRPIVPVTKLSENPEALWFQDNEFHRIKQKSWKIIHEMLECKQDGGTSIYCTRGLERMLKADEVQKNKYASWDSVINEQDLQRQNGIYDEQYLANKYRIATAKCQQEAQRRAKHDEEEIRNYMRSTRKYVRRLSSA